MDYSDDRNCFTCNEPGHISANCPTRHQAQPAANRPVWCGECDKQTRLIDRGDSMARCWRCWGWPAKGTHNGQLLAQHRICGGCGQIAYAWDQQPCGAHTNLGIEEGGRRAPTLG
jgi:hypothetical protein